jgi:hypothetical protein
MLLLLIFDNDLHVFIPGVSAIEGGLLLMAADNPHGVREREPAPVAWGRRQSSQSKKYRSARHS